MRDFVNHLSSAEATFIPLFGQQEPIKLTQRDQKKEKKKEFSEVPSQQLQNSFGSLAHSYSNIKIFQPNYLTLAVPEFQQHILCKSSAGKCGCSQSRVSRSYLHVFHG